MGALVGVNCGLLLRNVIISTTQKYDWLGISQTSKKGTITLIYTTAREKAKIV